jgi:hypothetical protein
MKTYLVTIPCTMAVCVEVEAESEEAAKRWFRKVFKPAWWVCEWRNTNGMEKGSFAVFGADRFTAELDAGRFIQDVARLNGIVEFTLRKPNLIERLKTLII